MSRKSNVEVSIGGKVYTLSGYEGAEYLQKVASYLNRKISEIHAAEDYRRLSPEMKAMLLQLNIADDYFKARDQIERLQKENERKDREIYDLKHNLVTSQLEAQKNKKELEELEETNRKLNEDKEELTELLDEALAEETDEAEPSENWNYWHRPVPMTFLRQCCMQGQTLSMSVETGSGQGRMPTIFPKRRCFGQSMRRIFTAGSCI